MDPLELYLKDIKKFPLLSREEEQALGRRIRAKAGELAELDAGRAAGRLGESGQEGRRRELEAELRAAKEELARANLRLVLAIAKDYSRLGLPCADLVGEGNLGLMKAVDGFDPSRGARFSTFAALWIRQSMLKAYADKGRAIRLPIDRQRRARRRRSAIAELCQEVCREPTIEEQAAWLGRSVKEIRELALEAEGVRSLDDPLPGAEELCLIDTLAGRSAQDAVAPLFLDDCRSALCSEIDTLSDKEAFVIKLRFGMGGAEPMTLAEIARMLGLSPERIRQIQEKALGKLEKAESLRDLHGMVAVG